MCAYICIFNMVLFIINTAMVGINEKTHDSNMNKSLLHKLALIGFAIMPNNIYIVKTSPTFYTFIMFPNGLSGSATGTRGYWYDR